MPWLEHETMFVEKRDGLAILTLNRPHRANSINRQFYTDINAILDVVESDPEIRVLLITGAGEKHFCAGADLVDTAEMAKNPDAPALGRDFFIRFEELPQPVIAVINGAAAGGGCELAIACDFRFLAEEAVIGVPEIRFGALPVGGGMIRLPRIVGLAKAKELVLTGRLLGAAEALQIGLVTKVAPRAQLMADAEEFARSLAALPAFAMRTGKMIVQHAMDMDIQTGMGLGYRLARTMAGEAAVEAARAQAMASSTTYNKIFAKTQPAP
jgi:enoyl-CoA hydratase/carnithine racemase